MIQILDPKERANLGGVGGFADAGAGPFRTAAEAKPAEVQLDVTTIEAINPPDIHQAHELGVIGVIGEWWHHLRCDELHDDRNDGAGKAREDGRQLCRRGDVLHLAWSRHKVTLARSRPAALEAPSTVAFVVVVVTDAVAGVAAVHRLRAGGTAGVPFGQFLAAFITAAGLLLLSLTQHNQLEQIKNK